MLNRVYLKVPMFFFCAVFLVCGSQSDLNVNSSPARVAETIFEVANNGKYELLQYLCDPLSENDGDTDCICALSEEYVPHRCTADNDDRPTRDDFIKYFKNGKIRGEIKISNQSASVPIFFGPDGSDTETLELVKRNGKWYLSSF